MKRVLVFLCLAAVGSAILIHRAGGLQHDTPMEDDDPRIRTRSGEVPDTPMSLSDIDGPPVNFGLTRGSVVLAPSERVAWVDPMTGEQVVLPNFFKWRFSADHVDQSSVRPVNVEHQSVECRNVVVDLYRLPRTLDEAKAWQEHGDLNALLDKQIVAARAHAQGSMATQLRSSMPKSERPVRGVSQNTSIRLYESVVIHDRTEGFQVQGKEVTVWPAQHRLTGRGRFVVTHQSLLLTGDGLQMDRDKEGWWRLEVRKNPEFRVKKTSGESNAKLFGGLSTDSLEPSRVRSEGPVVIVRKDGRRESRLKITFPDVVHVEHADGKSLRAGALNLVAVRPADATESAEWNLRDLKASKGVDVEYPDTTPKGAPLLASVKAESLIHQIPRDGSPSRTELVGRPSLVIRGQLPLGFVRSEHDRLHVSCHGRAWIDAVRTAPEGVDLPLQRLRIISLRGGARLERHSKSERAGVAKALFAEDTIDADEMDLLVFIPKKQERTTSTNASPIRDVTAVEFIARGNVRLSGTRVEGATDRIVAKQLHTHAPHVYAQGNGAHYSFPDIPPTQRFAKGTKRDAHASPPADTRVEQAPRRLTWLFHTVLAEGAVEIRTEGAGPAIGLQTHTHAGRIYHDHSRGVTSIEGTSARPADIRVDSTTGREHRLQARRIVMDQVAGTWVADGGVEGDLYMAEGRPGTPIQPRTNVDDAPLTLTIHTDERIDLYLARKTETWTPDMDARQRVVIAGPLRAELTGRNRVVDQLRADRVELTLRPSLGGRSRNGARSRNAGARRPGRGVARARSSTGESEPASTSSSRNITRRSATTKAPTHIRVKARRLTAYGDGAEIRSLEAEEAVSLRGDMGHLTGHALDVDLVGRTARLTGKPASVSPARAYLGKRQEPADIAAKSFALTWSRDTQKPTGLRATSYTTGPSRIRFSRPVKKGGGRERITIFYSGTIDATNTHMRFGKVKVIRELLTATGRRRGRRAELRAPTLEIAGTQLLGTRNREITTITAAGEPTYFTTTLKAGKADVWAERAVYDLRSGDVRLDARNGRDVQIRIGESTRPSRLPSISINLMNGTTSAEGGADIVIQPR